MDLVGRDASASKQSRPGDTAGLEHDSTNHFAVQSERPSLSEVRRAVPARSSGAPSRTRSHYDRILALLRERGTAGVLSSELYDAPQLFGRSPRNRISELRADGHLIQTVPAGASVVRYILTHENPSPTPRPSQSPKPAPLKSWEQVCAERERKLSAPQPEFELTP